MGYSKSPSTVNKIRAYIAPVFSRGRSYTWKAPFLINGEKLTAFQWAYRLREARAIIVDNPTKFPEFAGYAKRFTIEQISDTEVQARIKSEGSQVNEAAVTAGETPVHMETASLVPMTIAGVTSVMEIINHFLQAQPTGEPFHYPDANLPEDDMRKLVKFALSRTPRWMVLQARGTNSLTLMKEDPSVPAGARVSFDA